MPSIYIQRNRWLQYSGCARRAVVNLVTITKFSELSGYSEEAIRMKIKKGQWLEGAVWIKAPDGRILIDLDGYDRWARGHFSTLGSRFRNGMRRRGIKVFRRVSPGTPVAKSFSHIRKTDVVRSL